MKRLIASLLCLLVAARLEATPIALGSRGSTVDVTRYATFQDAIDHTPTGGTLIVPEGKYNSVSKPRVVPMFINRQIHILGMGTWHEADTTRGGAIIIYSRTDSALITIDGGNGVSGGTADGSVIENLSMTGVGGAGTGKGLVLDNVHHFTMRDCSFYRFQGQCVDQGGTDPQQALVFTLFDRCSFLRSTVSGLVRFGCCGPYTTHSTFRDCHFIANNGHSLELGNCQGTLVENCVFENDVDQSTPDTGEFGSFIYAQGSVTDRLRIIGNWFERNASTGATPTNWLIFLSNAIRQVVIEGNLFTRPTQSPQPEVTCARIIRMQDVGGLGPSMVRIANNYAFISGNSNADSADVQLSTQAVAQFESNYKKDKTGVTDLPWRVTSPDFGHIVRVQSDNRFRLRTSNQTTITNFKDKDNGDMAFNNTDGAFQVYQQNNWRKLGTPIVVTGPGPPQSGTWSIGDLAYSTTNDSLFVRKTAGTGIAATDWKGTKMGP